MRITKWWPIFPIRITGGPLQMDAEVHYGSDRKDTGGKPMHYWIKEIHAILCNIHIVLCDILDEWKNFNGTQVEGDKYNGLYGGE